jgi:DNA-binding MarR family transcriptional regulator
MYSASRAATAVYRPILEELGLDSGTLSPLLKRLESLGYVERRRSAADERRVEVFLTESGAALSARATGIPQRLADAAGLSANELDQLRETLGRLTAALQSGR